MKIILVSIGNFQEYILDNIKNLLLHKNYDITVITEKEYFNYFYEYPNITLIGKNILNDYEFNKKSQLDKVSRDGFWHLCSARLFYLYSYIEKFNIKNSLHIENDVLIYHNLNYNIFNSNKVCCAFDCDWRVIPSIIYIPNASSFKPIIENYDCAKNDMENLGRFSKDMIERLPISFELYNNDEKTRELIENYGKYNLIFDAAAIGQYLGGVDPRNIPGDSIGFVNETCLIKYDKYKFKWIRKIDGLYYPYLQYGNRYIQIFNLHIHSKQLKDFMSNNPKNNKFINM